jgi:pimeloyl-ACP methyl ester carboxylesterase
VRSRFDYTRRDSVDDIVRLMKHTPDLRDAIRASDLPKLVIIGEHDLWPVDRHAAFAERIGAELAIYDTGHSPCETTPHQLTRDLLALYAKVDAG